MERSMTELCPVLVLVMLAMPAIAAAVVAALGVKRPAIGYVISVSVTLLDAAIALVLVGTYLSESAITSDIKTTTFHPRFGTIYEVLRLGPKPGEAIRFFVGVDGLSLWLVALTAILTLSSVLVSRQAIRERAAEFYAWLLLLETGMLGVFMAFDIILFYVFFELTLVPLFFLIGIWGGPQRRYAARKFFIYTLAGSLITLLGVLAIVIACFRDAGISRMTFSIPELVALVNDRLSYLRQNPSEFAADLRGWRSLELWVFLALAAGFAIKVPLFPLHTWLPLAHVEAPTAGSVLLAGVLLKLGVYGFLRLAIPLAPDAAVALGVPLLGTLAAIGVVYGALCAVAQDDIKKLVAYSSVSHMGVCMLGIVSLNPTGLAGGFLEMINHGLSTGALFLIVGMLYERYHTRRFADYGGLGAELKVLASLSVFFAMSSAGLPGLNGFVSEVLSLFGIFEYQWSRGQWPLLAVIGASGMVLGAWYLLTMVGRIFFGHQRSPAGPGVHAPARDLNGSELAALLPIAALCLWLGVAPQPVLNSARPELRLIADIAQRASAAAGQGIQSASSHEANQ
jgi:NADH-quinone oxidoreductase subunit M